MKALPQNGNQAGWANDLVNELSYIRQHLRYRPKLSRLLPTIFGGAFLILLLVTVAASIYDRAGRSELPGPLSIILTASVLILFSISLIRYFQSLKFISISTNYHASENMMLIRDFLRNRLIAHAQHPEIPEVFQILSRNISAGNEDREVLIFIADDKRILLNSHFTVPWSFFPRKHHHKEMAGMLKGYINNLDHSAGLMHQTF